MFRSRLVSWPTEGWITRSVVNSCADADVAKINDAGTASVIHGRVIQ
jgi:hypothetical protein